MDVTSAVTVLLTVVRLEPGTLAAELCSCCHNNAHYSISPICLSRLWPHTSGCFKFTFFWCVSLVISCRSLSAEHRSRPMVDVQRTFSYTSKNICRGQIYSAFEVHILHFSFSLCAPLYTKFLGQETFLSCLTLQVKFYVRVPFLYNKFNIEIHTSFSS